MNSEQLRLLTCPHCSSAFRLVAGSDPAVFQCESGHEFPILDNIPRFVPPDNYADSFGFQWKAFRREQLDSYNGTGFSAERFHSITGWTEADLAGKKVLDAGCGAGRFAEVALRYNANLVACDLSAAIDVCRDNLAPHRRLSVRLPSTSCLSR